MSNIFKPYRALGLYSGAVPHIIRHHPTHKEYYITVAVGYVFHTFKLSNLGIVAVSDKLEENITSLAANNKYIFASAGKIVYQFSRGRHVTNKYCGHNALITALLDLGSSPQVISSDCEGNIKLWNVDTSECMFSLSFAGTDFSLTCMMHPVGYTNKLLFASQQGSLQLWNLRKNKQLHTFTSFESGITCIVQAPAQDVCAIGLLNGSVVLHNIRYDKTVMSFQQDGGAIIAISFRTDCKPEIIMVTGNATGQMHLWALSECRSVGENSKSHMAPIAGLYCIPGHPYMVTNAGDNSLKVWHFDRPDGLPQVLHSRMGHWEPPNQLAFWKTLEATQIISSGKDSTTRVFSTVHDKYNRSLGRAYQPHVNKKRIKSDANLQQYILPHVSHLVCQEARSGDWDTICATHQGIRQVTTWDFNKSCRGKHWLQPAEFTTNEVKYKSTVAECLDMTSCGNFVVIGYSSGHVFKFNIQSGFERGSYGKPTAHVGSVTGLVVNNVNRVLISTGDCVVKFWNFTKHQLIDTVTMPTPIIITKIHRESDSLALGLKSGHIVLVDAMNRHIVRRFYGHRLAIRDITFSADSKLIISTGEDCLIKVWDVIDAKLVDCFRVNNVVSSLAMSPVSDFLATTHENELGVYLWTNRGLYKHLTLTPLDEKFEPAEESTVDIPGTVVHLRLGDEDTLQDEAMDAEDNSQYVSPSQLQDRLITLSSFPASFWTTLINLKSIKERNKPKEPPSVSKDAPFFLPTIETDKSLTVDKPMTIDLTLDVDDDDDGLDKETPAKKAKVIDDTGFSSLSTLSPLLIQASRTNNYEICIKEITKLGPSAMDLEISLLAPSDGGSVLLLCSFIDLLQQEVDNRVNVDLVQALSIVFYRKHCDDVLISVPQVREKFQSLIHSLLGHSGAMQLKIDRILAMIHFIKNTPYSV